MDLQTCMDRRKGRSTISDEAWGTIGEEGALGVPKSKVSIPVELLAQTRQV